MRLLRMLVITTVMSSVCYPQEKCGPVFEQSDSKKLKDCLLKLTFFKKAINDASNVENVSVTATFKAEELAWAKSQDPDLYQSICAFNNLSDAERAMVRIYSQSIELSWRLNAALWNGDLHVNDDPKAILLRSALQSLPKASGTFYSGVRVADVRLTPSDYVKNNFVDGIFEARGFLSSSADSRVNYVRDRPIVLVIRGKTGVNIAPFSNYPFEKEILFPPGTQFKLISVESIPFLGLGQKTVITVQEI